MDTEQLLTPREALAKGFISIKDALEHGLSKKDRTTLYREGKSGAVPACYVGKGSRPTMWLLKSALAGNSSSSSSSDYEKLLKAWVGKMRNGTFGKNKKPYSEDTISIREWALGKYWLELKESKSIKAINAANFSVVMSRFEHDVENHNDHHGSKMQIYKAITGFVIFLIKEGLKTKEDLEALREERPAARYKPKKKVIEDFEIAEAIKNNREWRASRSGYDVQLLDLLLHLYGYAGLRREEAIQLKRENIFLKDRLIKVFGKNFKERFVTPHPNVWPALEKWLEDHCKDSPTGLLILNNKGQKFVKRNVNKRFEVFSQRLGKEVHPHMFRRGFAVMMANLGMPLNQLQIILGHEDIKTTMGYVLTNYKHAQKWVDQNLYTPPDIDNNDQAIGEPLLEVDESDDEDAFLRDFLKR